MTAYDLSRKETDDITYSNNCFMSIVCRGHVARTISTLLSTGEVPFESNVQPHAP
jgi:hypothetical protein